MRKKKIETGFFHVGRVTAKEKSLQVVSAEAKGGPLDMKVTVDRVRLRFVTSSMRSRVLFMVGKLLGENLSLYRISYLRTRF